MDDQYKHGPVMMTNLDDDRSGAPTTPAPTFSNPSEQGGRPLPPPPPSPRSTTQSGHPGLKGALAGGLVGALVAGGVGLAAGRMGSHDTVTTRTEVVQAAPAALSGSALDIHTLLDKVTPSVVSIQLGQANGDQVVDFAAGSGVIISSDGLVLTNAHVVDGADVINVHLSDDRTIRADLVGTSPSHDIALVRLRQATNLTPATLGSSAAMQVGDQVVAIGNALALGDAPTVTTGIVSAKDRTLDDGETTLTNLIQTDAAINHGNSGGPLLNAAGQVVGINSAGIPNAENLGFAIEIDAIKPLIAKLKTGSGTEVQVRAFLGIESAAVSDLTSQDAQQLGVTGKSGVVIVSVQPESAASDAGLEPGDLVRKVNGTLVSDPSTLRQAIQGATPGAKLAIEVDRHGTTETLDATLGSQAVTSG
jgi:S1-C subfamily serine protease